MNISIINIEKTIGKMFEKEHSIFMGNATTGLWALLTALGLKGKKVIVPVNVCYVVPLAIFLSGNEPYFVDISEDFTINPTELKMINSKEVTAVIFPYMYGNTANINDVSKICKEKNWILIEDVAPALGAKVDGHYAGSFSDFSVTSFGMGKIIDVNVGGVLSLSSDPLHKEVLKIYGGLPAIGQNMYSSMQHFSQFYFLMVDCLENGEDLHQFGVPLASAYKDCFIGKTGTEVDSALFELLEKKLLSLPQELDVRTRNAEKYQALVKHENVAVLAHKEGATYWRQNVMVKKDRNGLLKYLKDNKVKASKYFPSIDRLFYQRSGRVFGKSDLMTDQIINLWPSVETSAEDIVRINSLINKYYEVNG